MQYFGVWCDVVVCNGQYLAAVVWILSVVFLIGLFLNFWGFIMKNNFSRMAAVGMVMWLGFAAGTANAAAVTLGSWIGSSPYGQLTAYFNNLVAAASTTFSDTVSFTIPVGASGNGSANAINLSISGPLTFTQFDLTDTVSSNTWVGTVTGSTGYISSFTGGANPGSYTLTLAGTKAVTANDSSYTGQIQISPVPEPETYAMLLAGLGLVGFTARRRKNSAA